jgi:hypothetical protein
VKLRGHFAWGIAHMAAQERQTIGSENTNGITAWRSAAGAISL